MRDKTILSMLRAVHRCGIGHVKLQWSLDGTG